MSGETLRRRPRWRLSMTTTSQRRRRSRQKMICSHFGSSHFLFERARCFSRSQAFLVLSWTGFRACTMEEKINEIFTQIEKLPLLMQSVSRFENCVQTLLQTVASNDATLSYAGHSFLSASCLSRWTSFHFVMRSAAELPG